MCSELTDLEKRYLDIQVWTVTNYARLCGTPCLVARAYLKYCTYLKVPPGRERLS